MQTIDSKNISLRFAEVWNIATAKFARALRKMDHHNLNVSWIAAVVMEFKVSSDWILTGRGGMFENKLE